MKTYKVGVVGVTGLVGQTMLEVLAEYQFPISHLGVFASKRSAGKLIQFKGIDYQIEELNENSFDQGFDIVLFAVEAELAKLYAPIAANNGAYVIDNSSAFRMNPEIPLIVPEVNINILQKDHHLIANPNCSTIQSVIPLKVIDELFGVKRVSYTSYQAVSGSGQAGIDDLKRGFEGLEPLFYPRPINYNVIPQIDSFLDNGFTKEEMKMVNETNKILGKPIEVEATCVRVPVFVGHSVVMSVETMKSIDLTLLQNALMNHPQIKLYSEQSYPTPIDSVGQDKVLIGRLRKNLYHDNQVLLWSVADNVRKGAASNAVQIAQYIIKEILK